MMPSLPIRQVHLDFHTSPHVPGVGAEFDAAEFVQTLHAAHINSVTVFAKCHHGYSYYPTTVGTPHPHLQRDLLGEMIAACHQAGIRTPVYTTVVWDELAWQTHPEWRQVAPDGRVAGPSNTPLKPGWKNLCMNSGYADYVIAQIEEILDRYEGDGLFIDIVRYIGASCVCAACLAQMLEQGVEPEDQGQLRAFTLAAERRFMDRVTAAIRAKKPEQTIFYNSRLRMGWDSEVCNRPELDGFTHLEIESLPGGFWGYDHFPMYVRYFDTFPRQLLAMTGRFHTTWGDFGGLRNRAALEFECFQALAHGAAISIGDQLHPRGRLEPAVYARIGEVYAQVERYEPWCFDTQAVPDIAVLSANIDPWQTIINESDRGALHVLEQLKQQFHFVDTGADLAPYSVVILPDEVPLDAALAARLHDYLAGGGSLLISDRSGLDAATGDFALAAEMGLSYQGRAEFAPAYLALEAALAAGIEPMPHVCELPGARVAAAPGAEVLARTGAPYFNRTWRHFNSHQYTPMEAVNDEPLVVQNGRVLYLARPLFREYAESARLVHKQVLANCLARLLPRPRVGANNLPSTAIVTVRRRQTDLFVHVLHYVHQRRGQGLDVIEDVLPLHDVSLSIRAERQPDAVRLVPDQAPIDWEWRDGYVRLTLPRVDGYAVVQLAGAE
jgi:hypothetical protein